jgi:hypothetical protein
MGLHNYQPDLSTGLDECQPTTSSTLTRPTYLEMLKNSIARALGEKRRARMLYKRRPRIRDTFTIIRGCQKQTFSTPTAVIASYTDGADLRRRICGGEIATALFVCSVSRATAQATRLRFPAERSKNGYTVGESRQSVATSPPTIDPAIPKRIVFPMLIGSGPGIIHRARARQFMRPLIRIIRMRSKPEFT